MDRFKRERRAYIISLIDVFTKYSWMKVTSNISEAKIIMFLDNILGKNQKKMCLL